MGEIAVMVFEATLQREGGLTFVEIPFQPGEAWGEKPRYAVAGNINGIAVRGALEVAGQGCRLRLGPAWMRDSGLEPGAKVTVSLSLEGPQEGNLAHDVAQALAGNPTARAFFDGLPTFYRKNFIRWIESAKREETRVKRIAEMVQLLEQGRREK